MNLFGGNELMNELRVELNKVEQKHIEFFKQREPKSLQDQHERLYDHYMMKSRGSDLTFNFTTEDLPKQIQDDCMEAFEEFRRKQSMK